MGREGWGGERKDEKGNRVRGGRERKGEIGYGQEREGSSPGVPSS